MIRQLGSHDLPATGVLCQTATRLYGAAPCRLKSAARSREHVHVTLVQGSECHSCCEAFLGWWATLWLTSSCCSGSAGLPHV